MPQSMTQNLVAERRQRVTISHLADALGLTKGTVSRALNGYPDISDGTRQRVRRQADLMGYRPMAHAQAIRTGRTRTLGLVLQTDVADSQRPFLSDFLAGLTQAASRESWTLTVATSGGGAAMMTTLSRLIDEQKADGFILPRSYYADPRVALLRDRGVPFVMFGRTGDPTECAWFDILGEDAMRDAVHRLAGHGHDRIAFINGGLEYTYSHLRAEGFQRGMDDLGLAIDPDLLIDGATTVDAGAAAARRLLMLEVPPTAIVCAVDMAALGVYRAAGEFNLVIGQDLSVISYDGIPEGEWAQPALTTFKVDSKQAGERLADLLIRRIRGAEPEALRESARARLHQGGSDGPPEMTSAAIKRRVHDVTS